jgi:hypothetical protein
MTAWIRITPAIASWSPRGRRGLKGRGFAFKSLLRRVGYGASLRGVGAARSAP